DNRRDPVRMLHGQTEPSRCTVIENVDRVAIKADDLGEAVDRLGYAGEGVLESGLATSGHVGFAESREVGRDDMEAIGQERDQIAEHMARTREAMEQQQLGSFDCTCLTIENIEAVHVGGAVSDGGHADPPPTSAPEPSDLGGYAREIRRHHLRL